MAEHHYLDRDGEEIPRAQWLADGAAVWRGLSSRAWAARVARDAAFYRARLHASIHELDAEMAALEAQMADLAADRHELEHHCAVWTAFAAEPGATPAGERGARYFALWDALPGWITEAAPGDEEAS